MFTVWVFRKFGTIKFLKVDAYRVAQIPKNEMLIIKDLKISSWKQITLFTRRLYPILIDFEVHISGLRVTRPWSFLKTVNTPKQSPLG